MTEGGMPRVLVVDDNPPTRYSTSRVLRARDFDVLEAATGAEALALSEREVDVVILDVNLPDIDGVEVCRRLRANPRTARTPVIHLSATFVTADAKVRGLEAGADGYLTHPVEPPVLIATVNAFLRARQAEEAMRLSEAKFKAVFENAANGIALLSEAMVYLEVNSSVATTLGRPRTAIVGQPLAVFLAGPPEPVLADINAGLAANGIWRGAFSVLRADGSPVELEWSISLHSDSATRLAVTTDISEQKAIAAERERLLTSERMARTEAERANQLKDEFLAAVSHELRTPLNAILGWTGVIRRLHSVSELARGADAIERNVRVQTQMIADLLDVSRITSGKLRLEPQSFDPRTALESSIGALLPLADAKGVTIETSVDQAVRDLVWDLARFQQVASNLVENAVKFSEHGAHVIVSLRAEGDVTILTVVDHGKGIAPAFLPHVFDRFRQEDAGSKRRHGGLGLGLAIVKQLSEAHGATVGAESPGEGLGATFTVMMPRLSVADIGDTRATGSAALSRVRVLVVDDDEDARGLICRLLNEFCADCFTASDVASAKRGLAMHRPDVVVSDISMPGEDGYDLIRYMRATGSAYAAIPAIALTAFARDEDRARMLSAGYQQHLVKPVDTLKLVEAVALLSKGA